MTTTEKSRAVLEMVCEENGVNDLKLLEQEYSDFNQQHIVAPYTIGLHHHTHDTASNDDDVLSVPALNANNATGPLCDASSHGSDLIVDNNIHIHTQAGSDINWTPETDRAIVAYMNGAGTRSSVLPDILSGISAFELLKRWHELDQTNVLPPNFGGSWTEGSYTDTDSTTSSYAESHPWAFMAKDFLNGVADVIDSAPYFWTVTIFKIYKARNDPTARALVLNDILSRHVNLIRSFADKQLPEGHIIDTAKLLDEVADSLADLTDNEVSEFARTVPNGDVIDYQAGADFFEHFNTFTNAYAAVTAIYKYMQDRQVIYPLIKLLVGGSLFAFGSHIGDSEVFTSENIKAATNTIYGFFRTGTVGAFMQVFDSIGKLFTTWINTDGTTSLTQHLQRTNKAEHYYQLGIKLLKTQPTYAIELVTVQKAYLAEVNDFIGYCVDHLGAGIHVKNPWQAAFSIISDRNRITWFQTTWRQLDAFYTIEISRSIRMQPCVFFLEAGSSIGKTTLQRMLNQMILTEHLGIPVDQVDTFTYPWPSDEPTFANGAKNSMITVIFDDIGALRHDITKSTGGDPFIKKLLGLLNMFPYGPDQASLENKGKIFLAPEVVILSTNNPNLGLHLTYNEPGAVLRRLGAIIHVVVAPAFATETATLDDKKLNDWCLGHPGEVPDAWQFRIESFTADNRDYNRNGKGIKVVPSHFPPLTDPMMDTPTFLKWASDKFAAHKAIHTSILDTLNVPFNFGPILRPDEEKSHSCEEPGEEEEIVFESQSGADAWFMAKSHFQPAVPFWAQYNITATIRDATNMNDYFSLFCAMFTSMCFIFTFLQTLVLLCSPLAIFSRSLYCKAVNWYNGLLPVRIIRGVNTGRMLVVNCHDRKRRALEWLDSNKRTIALLTTVVGVGAVAAYAFRSRKKNRHDHQVGDEQKDPRKGFTVNTTLNDRISRWETMGTMIDMASMYGLSQQSLSASGSNVVSITANNMVDITFSCSVSSYKCAGIMVGGRRLILNRHSLPQCCKQRSTDPKWSEYLMTIHGVGYNNHDLGIKDVVVAHDCINANYLPGRDLAGIMLPVNCRPHRDIVNFFPKAPNSLWTKDFVYTRSIMPPGTKMALGRKTPVAVDVSPYGLVVPGDATPARCLMAPLGKPRKITLTADDIDPTPVCFQLKTTDVVTLAGHCGSPYFLYERMDNIGAIGGIHLGQLVDDHSIKVVIPIYCTDIVALFSDIEAPPESEAGPIMSETETQSGMLSHSFATCKYELQQGDAKFDITLHNSPKLSTDSYWAQNTIDYMKEKMGVEVNVNSYAVLGYDTGGGNLSSDFQKSPMYESIYNMDSTGLPDNLRSEKHVNNLTRSKRNHDAAAGIAAIMTHADHNPVLADEFSDAAQAYFESIVTLDEKGGNCIFRHVHPVDVDIAINGSHFSGDGITTTNHKGMEAMAMKTSPGHPWVMMFPDDVQEGIQRVGKYPWFKCAYQPDGTRHYTMGPQLSASYQELLSLFKKDHKTKVKFVTACKDEVKKDSKPTRLIMVGPQCLTIVCREFLMTICRVMQLNPFVFGAVVGLDATCVQWDQVHNFICGTKARKRYTFDGDYKDFDKSLFQEVTDGVKWVILSICECSGNFNEEQMFIVESILCCLLSPVVDVFGVVYWFRSFNTSGNSLTTQINCIANMLFIWVAWTRRMKKDMGSAYDERLSREMFNRLVHVVTYGDDHLVGVTYPDMLNCRIMEQELSQLITYTDAHKNTGADIAEFSPHEELIFLGRSMVIDETGSCRPPLEFKRLAKTCLFFRKRAGMQYEHMIPDLFRGILLEVHFHGEDVYNLFYERILEIMCEYYSMNRCDIEITFFMDTSGELLTYDYFRRWWLDKKDNGYLRDPKYEMIVRPDPKKDRELHDRYLALKALGAKETNVA